MNRPPKSPQSSPPPPPDAAANDTAPGVPGFRTWRGVYLFVFVAFLLVVAALTWFARVFA